jgi:hypothetical protein
MRPAATARLPPGFALDREDVGFDHSLSLASSRRRGDLDLATMGAGGRGRVRDCSSR